MRTQSACRQNRHYDRRESQDMTRQLVKRSKKPPAIAGGLIKFKLTGQVENPSYRAPTNCFFFSSMISSWMLAGTFL